MLLRLVVRSCVWGPALALLGSVFPTVAPGPAWALFGSPPHVQTQVRETAAKVRPAVVTITTTGVIRDPAFTGGELPFGLFPEASSRRFHGQGSGVIVSSAGLIITNHHVVADTTGVDVILTDRRTFAGRVVAADPKSDVAVVKIEAKDLPFVPWGDSSRLAVGDFVLAIGNPLGLHETVTFGIVSAVGRADVGVADYEDFIQTDAPINMGNSGGALVNLEGELIGINTAIASPTGASIGVGFAIPSNMARAAMDSLLANGRVIRGSLGAAMQDVTPALGKFFQVPEVRGSIITNVIPQGAADRAGLKRGDVIVTFDGLEVLDAGRLRNFVAAAPIGSRHRLDVLRNGIGRQVEIQIQEAAAEPARGPGRQGHPLHEAHPLGGLLVDDLNPVLARQLGLTSTRGVVVVQVDEGSLAEDAGLIPGDVVLEVNRQPIQNLQDYQRIVQPMKPNHPTLFLINRLGTVLFVPIVEG